MLRGTRKGTHDDSRTLKTLHKKRGGLLSALYASQLSCFASEAFSCESVFVCVWQAAAAEKEMADPKRRSAQEEVRMHPTS